MSKVNELEQALYEEKRKQQAFEELLEEAKTLEGRYFETAYGVIGYLNIKRWTWRGEDDRIEYTSRYITSAVRKGSYGAILECGQRSHEYITDMYNMTSQHIREITKEEFEARWKDVKTLVAVKARIEQNPVDIKSTPMKEIDMEFVILTACEASILRESPYMLPNLRHLITKGAQDFVKNTIREERASESRCSHLYAECDRRYVEGKYADWKSLEIKFKL